VDKHYHLPVQAVVETMKASPEMVMLQSHLSSLPGISKECFAQLILGQGGISSCVITATTTGAVLFQQQEALSALAHCGDLNWSVVPAPSLHATNVTIPQKDTRPHRGASGQQQRPLPFRRNTLTPEILASLSHAQRRVLVLVDGKRSIEEIAHLLSKTPQEVHQLLVPLQSLIHY
jgi:hypothetical protein